MEQDGDQPPQTDEQSTACRFVERIGYLEPDDLSPLLHEDFIFRTMFRSSGLPLHERADRSLFLAFLVKAREIFPNLCPHRVVSVISQGNHVVVESECRSLFADGRIYSNQFSFHFIMKNGMILEVREYTDFLHTFETVFSNFIEVRKPEDDNS